jgi:D-lactate dehydrogenase
MKKTSLIINTARGGLVDTHALVKALQKKAIRGAGLDVLDEEYSCVNGKEKQLLARLTQFENVIVTPHNAFNSDEACRRMLQITLENIHSAHHAKKGDNRVI